MTNDIYVIEGWQDNNTPVTRQEFTDGVLAVKTYHDTIQELRPLELSLWKKSENSICFREIDTYHRPN